MVTGGAAVPEGVMSPPTADGQTVFTLRNERVPILDKVEGEIPAYKNWFEEGVMGAAAFDQFALTGTCASAWAFSTVSTL
jgi:hypothetical protein